MRPRMPSLAWPMRKCSIWGAAIDVAILQSIAVAIPGIYPKQARPSHFRPVLDIARIVVMVAGRLLRRGMHPVGLWRSLNLPMAIEIAPDLAVFAGARLSDASVKKAPGLRQ